MTDVRLARIETLLNGLERKSRVRRLTGRAGHDFASNDYLSLAGSPRLARAAQAALQRGVPVGATGSRLLRGNHPEHEALESEAAALFGSGAALYFGAGYAANVALLATLPQRGDTIFADALVHASVHEGLALGRAAVTMVPHNDAGAMDDAITRWRAGGATGTPWIVVESVYSMDGDVAPLADLAEIAERHEAMLIVDEAHATGVLGPEGRGLSAPWEGRPWLIAVHTCGKALGTSGALVTADATVIAFLVTCAKPFIYATAPSPLIAAVTREALRVLVDEPERRQRHAALVESTHGALRARVGMVQSQSHIVPIVLGANARAMRVAAAMQDAGFDVRAVRPPTVPEGTARLRISLTLGVDVDTVTAMVDQLGRVLADNPT